MWRNFLLVTESAADGCLATTNASGAQPPERFGKKEKAARLAFSIFVSRSAHSHTEHWEEKRTARSLSVSPSVTQVRGFFPLTFRVSSASGLFFTLVCSTYLLTSRVLVNVGFVQTWCLVECDSRLCLSEIFFSFLNRQLALTSFFYFTHWVSDTFLLYFIKKKEVVV